MSEPTPGSGPSAPGDGSASSPQGDPSETHPTESHAGAEAGAGEPPLRRRSDRHKNHKHPWLRRGGIAVAAALAVALVLSVVAYVKLTGNINRIDITDALGKRPDKQATTDVNTKLGPMNILVMGSDTRAGSGND